MADNIMEKTKPLVDDQEMADITSTEDAIDDEKRSDAIDTEIVELSPKELSLTSPEKETDKGENLAGSMKQQSVCKTDCNGDPPKEAVDPGEGSTDNATSKTKESNLKESNSVETKSSDESAMDYLPDVDERLSEILKVVHGDLHVNFLKSCVKTPAAAAQDDAMQVNSEKEQVVVKKTDILKGDTVNPKDCAVGAKDAEDETSSRESMATKDEQRSELGIVGPPTAVSELINEEELGGDSALSADQKEHIVEWVENSVKVKVEEENNHAERSKMEYMKNNEVEKRMKRKKINDAPSISPRKSQKLVSNIIKKSIKCLNKMHAMEGAVENKRNVKTAEEDKTKASSSQVPQSQQNGAALPEETATAPMTTVNRVRTKNEIKNETSPCFDVEVLIRQNKQLLVSNSVTPRRKVDTDNDVQRQDKYEPVEVRKRKSTNGQAFTSGSSRKKFRNDNEREELILKLIGNNNETLEELMARATRLRSDILTLKELANIKEQEWNEILRKRKLTEEAYLRLERKIQTAAYMENEEQQPQSLPPAGSSLNTEWQNSNNTNLIPKEKAESKEDVSGEERSSDLSVSSVQKRKTTVQQRMTPPKSNGESNRKQNEVLSPESRQIGEGRQGAIVDVRSIIADHRLKHPETSIPRRGRRMRNSVNIGLGAGGAMVETGHNADSRPSSTESCKSNPSASDSMNYKDMLVQFAKMSQQGEPVKVPQNYPDVTLHPVTPSSVSQNAVPQPTGSLLHGILTKAQSPRSTTFSPTLARLLTAPERERNSPTTAASMSQQSTATQHVLQTYQGSNLVSINDLLSSSKARTEITITPVVNTPAQSHSNDLIQVDDVEEETTIIDERKGNTAGGRDSKQVIKDNPPSPNAGPKCQGCIIRPAQFVCAGCGNQWYCSRSCQLAAWATHSDHCPPEPENSKIKSNA